jgi:hypothetical protein
MQVLTGDVVNGSLSTLFEFPDISFRLVNLGNTFMSHSTNALWLVAGPLHLTLHTMWESTYSPFVIVYRSHIGSTWCGTA